MLKSYKAITSYNSLSDLIVSVRSIKVQEGEKSGICAFCGKEGENLLPLKLKKTFTRADYLHDTGLVCGACNHLYNNQDYRKKNWVVTKKFEFLGRLEMIDKLLSLTKEDLPFAAYTTSSYKKQGWLVILNTLNYRLDNFIVAYDMETMRINKDKLLEYKEFIEKLRKKQFNKTELRTGKIKAKNLDKIDLKHDLPYIENNRLDPLWDWVVNYVK